MVATGYEFGSPSVIHADIMEDDDDSVDTASHGRRTPRLDMNELFFGDTFGEPLDFLLDSNLQLEKRAFAGSHC